MISKTPGPNQHKYMVEDWAGLVKVKLVLGDGESAREYSRHIFEYIKVNPMRAFRFSCETLVAFSETEAADDVQARATEVMQDYLI